MSDAADQKTESVIERLFCSIGDEPQTPRTGLRYTCWALWVNLGGVAASLPRQLAA